MEAVPARARAYIACAALGALFCVLPLPGTRTPWWAIALLAVLYAACEQAAARWRFAGTFYPVLLAAAFLLPPPAAALVALPGALLSRVDRRPRRLRRAWRAAQLVLGVWAASRVHWALGGRDAVVASEFPYALVPAGAAVLAFCLVLTALDGGIRALADRLPVRHAWRGLLVRSLAPVAVHGLAGLMMAVLWRSPYGPVAALLVLLPMCVSWWVFAQYHRERAAHQATIRALVQAVDIKDEYTRGHSERVGQASMMIARELGMDDERVEVLRFAGILHDVGKLGVPTRLLRKDGPLTPEERRVIELHPEYGHEMVRGIGFLGEARAAVLHHHERLDGSGYPYGLRGAQIPESARVVAVADAFDAMTSTRSYRRSRPVPAALQELERCAGSQFDPRMVTALMRALGRNGWHPAVTAQEQPRPPAPATPVPARPRTHR
ncbi:MULTISPECIES: HD-GYP domain-containing protein [unclassified Streptomyces]|uniref:HD-GYP domain-containing protein n=1 Tax=unclassified Streptomyces TaxID=2593676 RepID=UPI0022597C99|nr:MULTISPECIES: HD-GYP domain-containing protein [unclassified Streptomyces]MCX4883480.1 HD-GYP domain-containing protein [Streptomyces sp. NBC_00847]MCX5423512.1 HD-GYP domain-containing protein [Streptomyces sp. NBC_00078]